MEIYLYIVTILNIVIGYIVLRSKQGILSIVFSLFSIFLALWSLFISLFLVSDNIGNLLLLVNVYYFAPLIATVLFLFFSIVYSQKNGIKINNRYLLFVISPAVMFLVAVIYNPTLLIQSIQYYDSTKSVSLNKIAYITYSVILIFYVTYSYFILFRTYLRTYLSDNVKKKQLQFIILGTLPAYILGVYFNLILPFTGNYELIWAGPVFTISMVISIGYTILRHNLFNIKVATVEVLVFMLWIFIFVRIIIEDIFKEQIISSILLIIVVVIGVILIRNIKKEIETREKVELLAEDLKIANEHLRELDQQKSEFVSIASHQLRSPLTAIKGYASMLLEGSYAEIPKENREAVTRILDSSNRLVNTVEDFLNVTRIEQGRMKYDFQDININDTISSVVEEFGPNIERAGLYIKFKKDNSRVPMVSADLGKIRHVILNLIDNAAKYTVKGGIEVSTKILSDDKINVCVEDTGIGIPEDFKDDMFGKFNRADNSKKIHANGSGIGLYIAKEIIEDHKGRIWLESKNTPGSKFCIELPLED